LLQSRIPVVFYDDALIAAIERKLKVERTNFPREYKNLDLDKFNNLVDNALYILNNDETRRLVLSGAEIFLLIGVRENNEQELDQEFLGTGDKLEGDVVLYLTTRAMKDFSNIWLETYPENRKSKAKKRFAEYAIPNSEEELELRRVKVFLDQIGLSGFRDTFKAHLESRIPQMFVDAKGKNQNLVYPL
jgi:hypothetical protein